MTKPTNPSEAMNDNDKVAEWMSKLGFEQTLYGNYSGNEMMINAEHALFFYQSCHPSFEAMNDEELGDQLKDIRKSSVKPIPNNGLGELSEKQYERLKKKHLL